MDYNLLTEAIQPWCGTVPIAPEHISSAGTAWTCLATVASITIPVVILKTSQAIKEIAIYMLLAKRSDLPYRQFVKLVKLILKEK